ncbi:MAG: AAA family ATPase [Actinobacteria bacterium]|nr:AAA family ATPase [Actinomycetota bacterium]
MGHDEFRALRQTGRTASRLLDNAGDGWTSRVMDLAAPVRGLPEVVVVKGGRLGGEPRPVVCDVVGASEELAEAEHRAQARWLLNVGAGAKADVHDARFLFRRCFHLPEVFAKYDVVLFDCPPRLTTASVNALGCSDFVLVPLLLDQLSVEALPRTLAWLERLPEVSRRARLLGVVGNRARYYRGELRKRQRDLFERLPDTIRAAVPRPTAVSRSPAYASTRVRASIDLRLTAGIGTARWRSLRPGYTLKTAAGAGSPAGSSAVTRWSAALLQEVGDVEVVAGDHLVGVAHGVQGQDAVQRAMAARYSRLWKTNRPAAARPVFFRASCSSR